MIERIERFENIPPMTKEYLEAAREFVLSRIDKNMDIYIDSFPSDHTENDVYPQIPNNIWTTSFWTGMLWLAYEHTGNEKYRRQGELCVENFKERFEKGIAIDTHDLGFLYTLSCVAPYKLTQNTDAAELALRAAYHLIGRYRSKGDFILAWGNINTPDNPRGNRMIIDCMMNLPLLYWAYEYSGNRRFYDIARIHGETSLQYLIRGDWSTHHTFYFDYETGKPLYGEQHQGYSNDSCWARGQAWACYGTVLSYIYNHDPAFLRASINTVDYFLSHLPDNDMCYYDLIFMDGDEPKDSSACALVICAMLELVKQLPITDPHRVVYEKAATRMFRSLTDNFTTKDIPGATGILKYGTVAKPPRPADVSLIYGDYYYFEALTRMYKSWNMYW